jgi:hypothetical protein
LVKIVGCYLLAGAALSVPGDLSLGLSALTLMDRRLELAIGVHAANNISTALFFMFVPAWPAQAPVLFGHSRVRWSHLVVFATQLGMIYLAARWLVGRRS